MISHSTPLGAVLFSCLVLLYIAVYLTVALPAQQHHVVQVKRLLLIQALRNQMMQLRITPHKTTATARTTPQLLRPQGRTSTLTPLATRTPAQLRRGHHTHLPTAHIHMPATHTPVSVLFLLHSFSSFSLSFSLSFPCRAARRLNRANASALSTLVPGSGRPSTSHGRGTSSRAVTFFFTQGWIPIAAPTRIRSQLSWYHCSSCCCHADTTCRYSSGVSCMKSSSESPTHPKAIPAHCSIVTVLPLSPFFFPGQDCY